MAWRFLSANNRNIARSIGDFPDARSCLSALRELTAGLGGADLRTVRNIQGMWCWRLRMGETELAISSHQYQRRIRAQGAALSFRDLAAKAGDPEDLRLVIFDRTKAGKPKSGNGFPQADSVRP
ncbi:hypothetical protein ORV05_11465 [Amycolatopsis cynarae]|uniref:DUF1508 domain-containing protein n=1 Tax=Amycolatopsis cynarae TaxID=2995223 RepID=A0ABY7B7N8_9PSEU|nr:hypothetical protein [Amycolatopsis sp. HUAS 11-8]WAL68351.1 hypothetical protein ORV05_11465 [Amycolatopsis sp. HUAS 11-8]